MPDQSSQAATSSSVSAAMPAYRDRPVTTQRFVNDIARGTGRVRCLDALVEVGDDLFDNFDKRHRIAEAELGITGCARHRITVDHARTDGALCEGLLVPLGFHLKHDAHIGRDGTVDEALDIAHAVLAVDAIGIFVEY